MAKSIIGTLLNNRYRVDEFLGRGGMSEVYKVWDQDRSVYLALKKLDKDLARDVVFLRRFRREAQNLAALQHPHIVRFYGLEQDKLQAFMLMDFVEGEDLKTEIFLHQGRGIPEVRVLEIIKPICSAVAYAHKQGVVHCDIKPGNILLENTGRVLVTDFGIARLTDSSTATMVGAGTPAYMAPEQVKGLDPVPQTDIYALGVMLFEMLTGGERPFTGERTTTTGTTSAKVRWEQVNLSPPSPQIYNPELSDLIAQVVLTCLAKDPKDRFQTAGELSAAFSTALEELGEENLEGKFSSAVLGISSSSAEGKPSEDLTFDDLPIIKHVTRERRQKQLFLWSLVALFISLMVGAGFLINDMKNQISNPVINSTQAVALIQQVTQTAQSSWNATTTQFMQQRNATQTVVALTPTITPMSTYTPTFTPTPIYILGKVLVKDDFEIINNPLRQFDTQEGHSIEERDNGNHVLVLSNEIDSPYIDSIGVSYGDQSWVDYCLGFDLIVVKDEDSPLSITIQHDPSGGFYEISFNNFPTVQVFLLEPNHHINLGSSDLGKTVNNNNWNKIEICTFKGQISANINNQPIINVVDEDHSLHGGIQLIVGSEREGSAIIEIDNLVVTELLPRP